MIEAYTGNPFAGKIYGAMRYVGGDRFQTVPVTNLEIVEQIQASTLKVLDYRAKLQREPGYASVFEGLAFDPDNIRTQSTAIYDGDKPIGLMTHVIAPRRWIQDQRYIERVGDGIRVRDFHTVSKNGIAEYVIIPGWTVLDPDYRYPKAIIKPAFDAFNVIIALIQSRAPANTYIEAAATGRLPSQKKAELLNIVNRGIDAFVPLNQLPFDPDLIGVNAEGSMASVSMATRLGLQRVENVGSSRSLGPVFVKKLE